MWYVSSQILKIMDAKYYIEWYKSFLKLAQIQIFEEPGMSLIFVF